MRNMISIPTASGRVATSEPLKLRFLGALVEQLGAQMYPSATSTVAELISNAWDADAHNVWVTIPFGPSWREQGEIMVLDDGHGMTRDQAQQRYLQVGRKRRLEDNGRSSGGRLVHGRKGIGKLAAFGTAQVLDCHTVSDGKAIAFRLDYDAIRNSPSGIDYIVQEFSTPPPLLDPTRAVLYSGTSIKLTRLRLKRAISQTQFMRSMSRRFSIDQTEMRVFINDNRLNRFDMDLDISFPKDQTPDNTVVVDAQGWGMENLQSGKAVRWWIGFTPKPLQAEYLRGISITARGKLVQRPFMFERSQGVEGQLGQEYVVGEVEADWLDDGTDIEDDLIQSNRDQLQLEDDRVQELLEWGRRRLNWALSQRARIRREASEKTIQAPDILELISEFTATEQRILGEIAQKASKIGDPEPQEVHDFMVEVVNGYKDRAVRELIERVQFEDEGFQSNFWGLVREFSLIDARKNYSIITARLETIDRLEAAIKAGATEVPEIHGVVREFPWLLDPRWSLLGDEINLEDLSINYSPMEDTETGDQIDFLFALQPQSPAPADEILVVEIKRGVKKNGMVHRVSRDEVHKFNDYVVEIQDYYSRNTVAPSIYGLMIADNYSRQADLTRRNLEQNRDIKVEFRTWEAVIAKTRNLHTSWLEVTRRSTG